MIKLKIFWVRTNFCTDFSRVFGKTTLLTLVLDISLIKLLPDLKKGLFTGMVLIDLQKVFDTTDHQILLKKVKYLGFSKNTIAWFKSYLCERKSKISLNTSYSSPASLLCGVPQGSALGPLFLLLYINDLPQAVVSDSLLYGDFQHKSEIEIEKQLIRDWKAANQRFFKCVWLVCWQQIKYTLWTRQQNQYYLVLNINFEMLSP